MHCDNICLLWRQPWTYFNSQFKLRTIVSCKAVSSRKWRHHNFSGCLHFFTRLSTDSFFFSFPPISSSMQLLYFNKKTTVLCDLKIGSPNPCSQTNCGVHRTSYLQGVKRPEREGNRLLECSVKHKNTSTQRSVLSWIPCLPMLDLWCTIILRTFLLQELVFSPTNASWWFIVRGWCCGPIWEWINKGISLTPPLQPVAYSLSRASSLSSSVMATHSQFTEIILNSSARSVHLPTQCT